MGKHLKLDNMDFDRLILTIVATLSGAGILGGIKAIVSQSSKNADFNRRITAVEDDHRELLKDVKALLISDAKKTVLLENMNKHIESVSNSTRRIHQRLDADQSCKGD